MNTLKKMRNEDDLEYNPNKKRKIIANPVKKIIGIFPVCKNGSTFLIFEII